MQEKTVSRLRRVCVVLLSAISLAAIVPAAVAADSFGAFFRAVKSNDASAVKSLLARGFDPNAIEPERGNTGLILALHDDAMKVFNVLLNAPDVNLEATAYNGNTALMVASFKGNKPAVEALLAKGAEVNRPGWTALHYAAASGHNDIVQLLLDKSAYIDAESDNKTTPLMMAARGGHIMTVKLLHDAGADATLKNDLGMTAVDFAKKFNFNEIAEGLTYRLNKSGQR